MDPNANLEEQRQIVARILAMTVEEAGETATGDLHADAVRLSELVEALDGWLSKGGFLPKAWERKPAVTLEGYAQLASPSLQGAAMTLLNAARREEKPAPTRAAFLAAYRAALIHGWAHDPVRLDRFMQAVVATLEGAGVLWEWKTIIVARVYRAIGGKGRLTLKALRALP